MSVKSSSFLVTQFKEMNEGIPDHEMKTNKPDIMWTIIGLPCSVPDLGKSAVLPETSIRNSYP